MEWSNAHKLPNLGKKKKSISSTNSKTTGVKEFIVYRNNHVLKIRNWHLKFPNKNKLHPELTNALNAGFRAVISYIQHPEKHICQIESFQVNKAKIRFTVEFSSSYLKTKYPTLNHKVYQQEVLDTYSSVFLRPALLCRVF